RIDRTCAPIRSLCMWASGIRSRIFIFRLAPEIEIDADTDTLFTCGMSRNNLTPWPIPPMITVIALDLDTFKKEKNHTDLNRHPKGA
ncbi:hypothetical protein LLG95_03890, partial [bacterium]|nr:hypothetical protein [bacterium]